MFNRFNFDPNISKEPYELVYIIITFFAVGNYRVFYESDMIIRQECNYERITGRYIRNVKIEKVDLCIWSHKNIDIGLSEFLTRLSFKEISNL